MEADRHRRDPGLDVLLESRCSRLAASATPIPSEIHPEAETAPASKRRLVHLGPEECMEFDVTTGELGSVYTRAYFFKKQRQYTL